MERGIRSIVGQSDESNMNLQLPVPMVGEEGKSVGTQPVEKQIEESVQKDTEKDVSDTTHPNLFRGATTSSPSSPFRSLRNSLQWSRSNQQPTEMSRPGLHRSQTSQAIDVSWSKLRKSLSSNTSSPSGGTTEPLSPQSSGATSPSLFPFSRNSSFLKRASNKAEVPDSPKLQAMLKSPVTPNLSAVNRALEEVREVPGDEGGKFPYIDSLTRLASELETASADCKEMLKQAMLARSDGKYEICRGLCVRIINNPHSEITTRIYALNILATQASPGQAVRYLNNSAELINKHSDEYPEFHQLLGVVATLKQSALRKEVRYGDGTMPAVASNVEMGESIDDAGLEMSTKKRTEETKSLPKLGTLRPKTLVDMINSHLSERATSPSAGHEQSKQ